MSFPLPKRNRKEERRMLRLVRSYSLSREDAALSRNALMSRRHSITIDRCLVNLSNVAYVLENDSFKLEAVSLLPKEEAEMIYHLSFWDIHFCNGNEHIVTIKEDILSWDTTIASFLK